MRWWANGWKGQIILVLLIGGKTLRYLPAVFEFHTITR